MWLICLLAKRGHTLEVKSSLQVCLQVLTTIVKSTIYTVYCLRLSSYLFHNNADSAATAVTLEGGNLGALWQCFWKNL